jgi:putative transposase
MNNQQIADLLGVNRDTVRLWRDRWLSATEQLSVVAQKEDEAVLQSYILKLLADDPRPGVPATFSPEQVCQIIALACELPSESERPVTHWTPTELAAEAIKRGIVESISVRTIGRFLK